MARKEEERIKDCGLGIYNISQYASPRHSACLHILCSIELIERFGYTFNLQWLRLIHTNNDKNKRIRVTQNFFNFSFFGKKFHKILKTIYLHVEGDMDPQESI